eukprot:TRINITY_DN23455_c0_g1_i1.p1 TRINITY_DN23455_c0_g1~~TRINITY_DN23455_c0_g1_i1.p1  ORF type:complete len:881 (+),score=143.03 TRINITY_DN23455_c0_g1_i1:90-2732(+)
MATAALALLRWPLVALLVLVQLYCLAWFLWAAYDIRMYPIKDFGYTIHEFDPWFNYRAAEYLAEHGTSKFFKWYDYKSWYPLGRPIGTTIYPGMQMTAVAIWEAMKHVPMVSYDVPKMFRRIVGHTSKYLEKQGWLFVPYSPKKLEFTPMTVNEICCMIPPWFGSLASMFCGLLTFEVSRSVNAGLMAVGIMAVIPAHLMRSVGGKFDNEAIAMAAICSTFWLWLRSVRTPSSWPFAVLAGLSYVYMVAAWGGYIFVLNMIGVHALMLVGLGRFNSGVHKAYTLFFVIGTLGAIQIPVVNWTPLRSIEQLGPLGVFLGYQVLAFCDSQRRKRQMDAFSFAKFRVLAFAGLVIGLMAVALVLAPMGYFGPLSSRIRGLFMKHTKTGNPLVDSVAEHQPANQAMYNSYLNLPLDYVYLGGLVCLFNRNNGAYFVALYGFIANHFSLKMSRLVLICGPIVSIVCAIWVGFLLDFILEPFLLLLGKKVKGVAAIPVSATNGKDSPGPASNGKAATSGGKSGKNKKSGGSQSNIFSVLESSSDWKLEEWEEDYRPGGIAQLKRGIKILIWNSLPSDFKEHVCSDTAAWKTCSGPWKLIRPAISLVVLFYVVFISGAFGKTITFLNHANGVAQGMSNAQVKWKSGQTIIDDPYAGYRWLAENTPKDARVMAWWDYGYQITGIGERTSLADGNTWNHEQIATLGRLLSSPQKKSHNAIRHLADYILIWAKKDLLISTHFARIGNSVFPDHCGDDDPYCEKYGFYGSGSTDPTPMMKKSLVYNLVTDGMPHAGKADPRLFELVHQTKHNFIRIFKVHNVSEESKAWVADPKNLICDAPGSWYCVGQFPPALQKLLSKRRSFSQVEDFNKKGEKSAYTKMIEKQRKGEL